MEKQLSAQQFSNIYSKLDIDLNKLGCVMLDLNPVTLVDSNYPFYTSANPDRFWIKGWVAGKTPHVTLLYGLLKPALDCKAEIKEVLSGWRIETVEVESVDFFESPYADDPYYCIIAKIKPDANLVEGHQRLEFLPHINTFTGYVPHFTLCYLEKDLEARDKLIAELDALLTGKQLTVKSILNLGENKD